MSAAPRRFAYGFVTGFGVAAGVAGVVVAMMSVASARQRDREQRWLSTSMRGVVQAMITWSQNQGDPKAEPEPDWETALVNAGYVPIEMLRHPDPRFSGVPPFIHVRHARERPWANSFNATVPVIIQNPSTTDGRGGLVAYNDNHVDFCPEPEFSRRFAALLEGGRAIGGFPNNQP